MNYFDSETWMSLAVPGQGKSQGRCHSLAHLHHRSRWVFHSDYQDSA
jgi:hypothetical protein